MWVYLIIGANGGYGFSFDLDVPTNIEILSLDLNRHEEESQCIPPDCPEGLFGMFDLCCSAPFVTTIWLVHATLNVLDSTPSVIRIVENPESGAIYILKCDYSPEYPTLLTNLYVNYSVSAPECGAMPTENSTCGGGQVTLKMIPPPGQGPSVPRPRTPCYTACFGCITIPSPRIRYHVRSKRSAFITLFHAAAKSVTNFSCESSQA
jgi:hypothetical protein